MSSNLPSSRRLFILVLVLNALLSLSFMAVCAKGIKTSPKSGVPPFAPTSSSTGKSQQDTGVVPVAEDDSHYDSEDENLSTHELLEKHGLPDVARQLASFLAMFDTTAHFFSKLNEDEHFDVLNLVIDAFKRSFVTTMNEVMNAKDAPSGPISLPMMKDFFSRQEIHFKESIKRDSRIYESEWITLLGQVHIVFDSLKKVYQLALENHMSLDWWMLKLASPMIEKIPIDLFDRTMFSELLEVPIGIKQTVHDTLESLLTSDYAPMLKIGAQLAANYDWRKLMNDEHAEL